MSLLGGEDQGLLLRCVRALLGWDQGRLAAIADTARSSISRYEDGRPIPPDVLERLSPVLALPWAERSLLPVLRAARRRLRAAQAAAAPSVKGDLELDGDGTLKAEVAAALALALAELEAEYAAAANSGRRLPPPPRERERTQAAETWARLASCGSADRQWLIEHCAEFRGWALAEHLCHESARAAPRDAQEALNLARLAITVAQNTPGDVAWRHRLLGYAQGFLANALRVAGNLVSAAQEMAKAWRQWQSGAGGDPATLLHEWRLLDLEASLRRDARQFSAALDLLTRAADQAPPSAMGRILVKRATTEEQAGDPVAALASLERAAPLIAQDDDPRLAWLLDFNLSVNLCHLQRFKEVEMKLPQLRQRAVSLANDLDAMRVLWLTGRVAAGQRHNAAACAAFEQVRTECIARSDAFGTAMVSLELAQLYLDDHRVMEVRALALEMAWVLTAERLETEALAALRMFHDAAIRQTASLHQVSQLLSLLKRSRLPLSP